ncbi:glycoside hydrolase family 13 protein [Mycena albidolilacea]|uniref:Glycoside hydrolase family 13 protein n=1 Tax=Mycena albidolilacea TaxID=1033008 RepID=A0AAD7F1A7_9AGAR|nr:glycoside hydrolase family 13 protein [Mycena albidolilacea]
MLAALKGWLSASLAPRPALPRMRLGPEDNPDNPLMLQFFTWDTLHSELSWWKHLEHEIPKLAEMGFTQVWLPPPNKGAEPKGRGYDAYDLWDLGEFDQKGTVKTRWGTRDELLQACKVAAAHGIDIIIDAVLNHKLGGDRFESFPAVPVNAENRLKDEGPVREIDGWTAFDFKGRGNKYSGFRWTHEHFSGLDWDHRSRTNAIYRIASKGRKGWSRHVASELGNYDYLLGVDIDHRHPEAQQDLLNWGVWILETTGAVGFRLDAIKHFDRRFLYRFITHVRRQSRKPKMFSVSEYWSADLKLILPYIKAFGGETTFFDVPLHTNFHNASKNHSHYDLRDILNNTIVKEKPNDSVTFVDNHDTVIGQSLESWVDTNFKIQAYSLILLRQNGHPCVFYGDLYPNEECYNADTSRNLTLLIEARKKFAYGPCHDYFHDPKCIGFVRMGDSIHPGCAVLLSNKEDATGTFTHTVRMFLGREHTGTVFRSFMSPHGRVNIDADGWGEFSCPANRVEVWVRS